MIETGLKERDIETIRRILMAYPEIIRVLLFGSRAIGTFKPGSDIDLAIMGSVVANKTLLRIKADFSESDLPYFVDILDYAALKQPELKEHINRVGIEFYGAG